MCKALGWVGVGVNQAFVHRITSEGLQKRTGVFSLEHYLASRTLLWAGHVARMPKNRLPKRLMLSWIREPRVAGGQEMTYGWSLQRHLYHFGLPTAFTEWAHPVSYTHLTLPTIYSV